jgi:hypothetical protein
LNPIARFKPPRRRFLYKKNWGIDILRKQYNMRSFYVLEAMMAKKTTTKAKKKPTTKKTTTKKKTGKK